MRIGGVNKLTLLDYPGRMAAILFTPECNLCCGYCHNPDFVLPERIRDNAPAEIPFEVFLNFLRTRRGFLDGVVISGGEPTLQPDLAECLARIRELGFRVKLDTNGTAPDVLQHLLEGRLIDAVAMDLKAVPENYASISPGCPQNLGEPLRRSIGLILAAGNVETEFRTTVLPDRHPPETLEEMARCIGGARLWALQKFRPEHVVDPAYQTLRPYTERELRELEPRLLKWVRKIELRLV